MNVLVTFLQSLQYASQLSLIAFAWKRAGSGAVEISPATVARIAPWRDDEGLPYLIESPAGLRLVGRLVRIVSDKKTAPVVHEWNDYVTECRKKNRDDLIMLEFLQAQWHLHLEQTLAKRAHEFAAAERPVHETWLRSRQQAAKS